MQRKEMIRRLTEATLESALNDPDMAWLRAMLVQGFSGYECMTDAALAREMQMRGLLEFDEPEPEEDFDDEEEDDDDEDERVVMLAEMIAIPHGVEIR
jgi:hypothetical protein